MRPLLTNTHVLWMKRVSVGLSLATTLAGGLILFGWVRSGELLPIGLNESAPVHPNAAAALAVLGISILAHELGRREFAWLAVIAAALGASGLVQSFFNVAFAFEVRLGDAGAWNGATPYPIHRFASICFLLAGATVAWLGVPRQNHRRTLALVFSASILSSVGFSTLLGYALSMPAVYRWGGSYPLPSVTAALLFLVGTALLLLAWREQQEERPGAPAWLPMPVVIASATLTAILWLGLREAEMVRSETTTQFALREFAGAVGRELEKDTDVLERFSTQASETALDNGLAWTSAAQALRAGLISSTQISKIDREGRTAWVEPASETETYVGFDQSTDPARKAALHAAAARGRAEISGTFRRASGELGFAIFVPMRTRSGIDGFTGAEFSYPRFFAAIARLTKTASDYQVVVSIGPDRVYSSGLIENVSPSTHLEEVFAIADRRVRVELTPTLENLRHNRRYLPELALAAGCGITLLLGLSIHLARTARAGLKSAELLNSKLQAENEQRRRIEQRLKVSDERLRLALDSTQIGIFEWNFAAHSLYFSPGIWQMLGYEPGAIPETLEGWFSLVHADDLPRYRAALEQQLTGTASFADPEYRIRTASGEWRWLYARSKVVAQSPKGAAEIIIGTVQDISARKRAEEALQVSQAATRKLSLVASKTDNLVIIASPEGTIEWVNESFERVMEYSLGEVAGRNPADFMIGPDTSSRTVRRIKSAMRRGVGISTDVVNYSKAGKKYHLHLEIQPVHNEAGELENFIAIQADISARVETENYLRRAKAEADAASRAKSEFLASMSHEIRTPMNGVIGMTSLLLDTPLSPEQRDYVNTIRNSGDALLTIINDILDFSKIESGKMELENLPFELAVCVEDSLDLFSAQAAEKGLELVYEVDEGVPMWVQGDVTRLRQVLANLVNNAVKFTPAGSIAVRVRSIGLLDTPEGPRTKLGFSVTDTGIGIPPDRLNRLFQPFSQVDSSTTRKYGGTGLGLAICHRLCHLMKGEIAVTSTVGLGSTFSFTIVSEPVNTPPGWGLPELPVRLNYGEVLCVATHAVMRRRLESFFHSWGAKPVTVDTVDRALELISGTPRPAAIVIDSLVLQKSEGDLLRDFIRQSDIPTVLLLSPGPAAQHLAAFTGRRAIATATKPLRTQALIRALQNLFDAPPDSLPPFVVPADTQLLSSELPLDILLVEDNTVNQKVALRFLDRLGYRADAVANGIEALNTLQQRTYQLVLMDLQMPEMDGFETARHIRKRLAPEKQPKIIALTANALNGDREECLAAGMDDYITKPVKLLDIVQVIRRQFSRVSRPPLPTSPGANGTPRPFTSKDA